MLAKLTEKMASFQYDRSRCFRAWLKTITQRVLSDLMVSRRRAVGSQAIPLLEQVEARADLERRIEEIFNRELLDLAISKVRERVAPATWDAFRLTAFEEMQRRPGLSPARHAGRIGFCRQTPGSEDAQGRNSQDGGSRRRLGNSLGRLFL